MQLFKNIFSAALFSLLCLSFFQGRAQTGFSFDIKKPEQYDDRVLGSEKSESKKFTLPRRFTQNTFTHYNYFFNANNKLNQVLEEAKLQHIDDYSELLPFYNYSLDITAENKTQLDSVIYKTNTGIVLHDLRNDWIDNLYLLTGAAYYLRKQFDSAYMTFQFINYAFAPKEKDGYYKTIGSKFDGNEAFSISTKEKKSLTKKVFSEPPSRNDAFIWQIRTLIASEEYAEAASLIITLRDDPAFPTRLKNDLEEVQAWWFYNNNVYDSAAVHLEKALSNAANKVERARWEFLIGQLYELSGKSATAKEFYDKVVNHTVDPVMEIYARLRSIRMNKEGGDNYIDRNVEELQKMAKRDKYIDYRDVIYYTMAQMEMERNNFDGAQASLLKSTKNNTNNPSLKNKAFLELASLAFDQRKYKLARNFYDSVDLNDRGLKNPNEIRTKQLVLTKITDQMDIIERQDSLQRIAGMPEEERKDFVKKLVRYLRKQQGLKEEATVSSALVPIGPQDPQQSTDLFGSNASKGDWYFNNAALKTKGVSEFKARWGNRPNVDNWRRSAGMSFLTNNNKTAVNSNPKDPKAITSEKAGPGEITFDALYENLPMTEEQMKLSNDSLSEAMYVLAKSMANDLEDCEAAIKINEDLIARFPAFKKMDEVLFTLYYCYKKAGVTKADQVKKQMEQKFPGNRLTTIVSTGKDPGSNLNPEATKAYEQIYNLFIEGDFTKAVADKVIADSLYGSTYWTPQLMYIESVYYIKQRQDSNAIQILNAIITQQPGTAMATKATTMIDVLRRRQKIEDELNGVNVKRAEDKFVMPDTTTVVVVPTLPEKEKPKQEEIVKAPEVKQPVKQTDTLVNRPIISSYSFKPDDKYYAVVLLNKVDMVWVNETKNAFTIYNRGKFYNKQFDYTTSPLNADYKLLLIGMFDNAQAAADYVQLVKPLSKPQIVPWLAVEKYSFTVISAANLEILRTQQDINLYKQFIEKNLPGKF
jgi:tetratricopeptide (TPR) repeat protein